MDSAILLSLHLADVWDKTAPPISKRVGESASFCGRHKFQRNDVSEFLRKTPRLAIDMKKTAENTKTATQKVVASPRQIKGVMSAVTAVVGEEQDTFADVDEHPCSLDLPTQKDKTTKLHAEMKRLPKGSAERFQAFRKLLKVLHYEYAE